ncbi:LamG domain-containing protein [Clostridium tetani]|uniref:Conserved protein n=2 Tax=root TaxID=1 RepID=Q895Z9_CLOTE|nr:LamG domain-containing protein [Clostridium tetani]AAO35691.1 conserved protein [Clostridium tetani E88]KGI38420.1 hypothetical protein KY52_08015 [Clostridium tetani]KGI42868.1 hypothetical protein KY54_12640 [Clostridium tetani]KHO33649.1 hypothetical protein OR63_05380 [Clostridium tetani]KIG21517.1 hypothetical protein RS78_03650 [Clostridium tetani]
MNKKKYSLNFKSDGYIFFDNFPKFGDNYTLQIWINSNSNSFNAWSGLFMRGDLNTSQGLYWYGKDLCFTNAVSGRVVIDTVDNFPIGSWHNITIAHEKQFIKYYRDGNFIRKFQVGKSINSLDDLYIGVWDNYSRYNGKVSEARVWSKALNDQEVLFTYNKELTGNNRHLVAHWGINEGNLTEIYDYSNNGYNGRVYGGEWVEDSPSIYCYKYLIKQDSNYYSIKPEYIQEEVFKSLILDGGKKPNRDDFNKYGFNNLNDLLIEYNLEKLFKPADILKKINSGKFHIVMMEM